MWGKTKVVGVVVVVVVALIWLIPVGNRTEEAAE